MALIRPCVVTGHIGDGQVSVAEHHGAGRGQWSSVEHPLIARLVSVRPTGQTEWAELQGLRSVGCDLDLGDGVCERSNIVVAH